VIRWLTRELLLLVIELSINATKKVVTRTKRYAVHDSEFNSKSGDKVRIKQTVPISKTKTWIIESILRKSST
jgi:small subunit ribosomal protein S17